MSIKEFWEEDPDLFWAYRFSYFNVKKEDVDYSNYIAWLNGAYVHDAVSVALNNAFSKVKIEYPKKPYESEKEDSIENEVISIQNRVAEVQALFKEKQKTERKEE
jgi:hypothetical protein